MIPPTSNRKHCAALMLTSLPDNLHLNRTVRQQIVATTYSGVVCRSDRTTTAEFYHPLIGLASKWSAFNTSPLRLPRRAKSEEYQP